MSKITVGIATYPARLPFLLDCLNSLQPQVDEIFVCLNEYDQIPVELQSEQFRKVKCTIPETNMMDAGKFLHLHEATGIFFSCDDDIIYPSDYVARTLERLGDYPNAIITYHGRAMHTHCACESYRRDCCKGYAFYAECQEDTPIHIAGTGVSAFRSDLLQIDAEKFYPQGMADIHFSISAFDRKIPVILVRHPEQWIVQNPKMNFYDTLGSKLQVDDSRETELVNTVQWTEATVSTGYGYGYDIDRPITNVSRKLTAQKVAVIVPNHNYSHFLGACLSSINLQEHPELDVLVVDDASDPHDNAKEIASEYNCRYMRVENRNLHQTRLDGLHATDSDYVIFFDADNIMPQGYITNGLQHFTNQDIGVVYADLQHFGDSNERTIFPVLFNYDAYVVGPNFVDSCAIIRREALNLCDAWDTSITIEEALPEDYWMFQRIGKDGWKFRKQETAILYRCHSGQMTHIKHNAKQTSYYETLGLSRQQITLFIPLSGRTKAWERMKMFLNRQLWPHHQIQLVLCDTSQNDSFSANVKKFVHDCDYPDVRYYKQKVGLPGLANMERRGRKDNVNLVMQAMCKIYTKLSREINTDYCWILEDDVIPPDDVLERLLKSFDYKVGTVSAPYESRYHKGPTTWLSDMVKDVKPLEIYIDHPSDGVTEIRGCGFGCLVVRSFLLRKHVLALPSHQEHLDPYFFQSMHPSWKRLCDWSCQCEHWDNDTVFRLKQEPKIVSTPTRFVILCQPRTGSTLLNTSLDSHYDIRMNKEVLNHLQFDAHRHLPMDGRWRLEKALQPNNIHKAFGCNLHAFQPDPNEKWCQILEPAWDILINDPTIKVIFLHRKNILAQFASWKVAVALNQWGNQSEVVNRPQVEIRRTEFRWFRDWNRAVQKHRLGNLKQHNILDLTYEDLTNHWEASMMRVQEFLHVEQIELKQSMPKSETRDLSEVISNWDDIKDYIDD